jgi:hypothetical protein
MEAVTVFTALYDLDRESIDSRSFEIYVKWLKATIVLFPGIVIFHGGELDQYNLENCRLINKPLSELQTFKFQKEVLVALDSFNPTAPHDITFTLPKYALLQYSKFEFATLIPNPSDSVLWVDAGISRFIREISPNQLDISARKLLDSGVDSLFEIDIRNNLNLFKFQLRDSHIGSCRRVISGGSFWIRTSFVPKLYDSIQFGISEWLDRKQWDNEQVMLRKILPGFSELIIYVPQVSGIPGCVPRSLSNRLQKFYLTINPIITKLLRRGLST